MNTPQSRFKRAAIFLISISAVSIPAISHADWSIKALDSLGGDILDVNAINDRGQIVGYSYFTPIHNNYHAFITGPDGIGMTDLGALGGNDFSVATAINESGQVTGHTTTDSFSTIPSAFITGPDGVGMIDLGVSIPMSRGTGINDFGQVVGIAGAYVYQQRGFSFSTGPNGTGVDVIDTMAAGLPSITGIIAINNSGQMVGGYYNEDSNGDRVFIMNPDGTVMTDLGTLGGKESHAFGINESGQVIGSSNATNGISSSAFVTGPNGIGMTNLGTFGGMESAATGINNAGEVVGLASTTVHSGNFSDVFHAFLFSHGGMTDLDLLSAVVEAGWTDLVVKDINNNGQIIGTGFHNGGDQRQGFMLSYTPDTVFTPNPILVPIPEPQTYAMLLAGLGVLGFVVLRRKAVAV